MRDAAGFESAHALVAAVRSCRITAAQAMRAFLDRTERLEPLLRTYVSIEPERALAAAHAVDARIAAGADPGPLAGLPVSVKDLIAVGGMRQTFGSELWRDHVAAEDAPSVARLRAAGACITGKTTTSELGCKGVGDSPLTGITRNPWDLERTPGGSSAGAAAGLAAGLVAASVGTDGGGSVRIPAAFCGLVGIKATFGRVPVWPASATPSLGHVGPLGRCVADAALLLGVMAGSDARDAASLAFPPPEDFVRACGQPVEGLRIGWAPTLGWGEVDAGILDACADAVAALRAAGVIVQRVDLHETDPAPAWNQAFYGALGDRLRGREDWADAAARIDPYLRRTIEVHAQSDAQRAHAMRAEWLRRVNGMFESIDVLATPAVPTTALPCGHDAPANATGRNAVDWSYFTYPFNLSGHPALSLPIGLDPRGLPIGVQLVGRHGAEATLVRAAAALERLRPFHHQPPEISA
ncbi:MAG TPA: amidase [Ramlibacter sp.]|uniref:amidase n=1 Tax=Ramlibacter sp. TaxID=1917967 RepID=UPI002C10CDF7|nr:amidase [Ramlibacter sp.]HVZ42637.1 amidase [Ramlibacter sp.]